MDSNDSSSSQVKIIIEHHKNELNDTNYQETNSTVKPNEKKADDDDETKAESPIESTNETTVNEQRTSVIVQPSRIPVTRIENSTNTTDEKKEEPKLRFLCESKLSQSVINNLFNSSVQPVQEQSTANSNVKLRPSVLRIGDGSSSPSNENAADSTANEKSSKESNDDSSAEQPSKTAATTTSTNLFKFAPLTDNKKLKFGSSISTSSSIMATSSFSGLSSTSKETGSKTTFLNNNGDNKTPSTNYFTENLFQQAAAVQSSNSPESSTFCLPSSNSESTGFVFGQNLQERVTNVSEKPKLAANETTTSQSTDASTSTNTTNSNTAAASSTSGSQEKRKFENITGEEEETNVMHIYCKLFHWDSESSAWKERGKGRLLT